MDLARLKTDVLIIGGGAAGCRAAIEAHDRGAQVILAVKGRFTRSGSTFYPLTIGVGYTTAVPGGDTAGTEAHYREIMDAGQGMVSPTLAHILAQEAPARLEDLIERYAMAFRVKDGEVLTIKPDFGSGQVRAGSATEDAIRESFGREIRQRGVRVLEKTAIVRLLGDYGGCAGAVAVTDRGDLIAITAKTTVLATGGGSTAFLYHMNTPDLTFDGHAMALELGAELVNMEFYQMILGLTGPVRRLLIPEPYLALQPRLTNGMGDEFLSRYLPQGVTQAECLRIRAGTGPFRSDAAAKYFDIAVFDEVRAGRGTVSGGVRADFTHVDPALIEAGKLDWYRWATARGVDVCARPVDVSPHVHAFNGGVLIHSNAETTVPNLFACGEAAGGPHGANRIGGNQFAGTQVFGERAGRFAAARSAELGPPIGSAMIDEQIAEVYQRLLSLQRCESGRGPQEIHRVMQTAMWNEMGVHKDAVSLERCLEKLSEVEGDLSALCLPDGRALFLALSLPHLLTTATIIARAALMREESRGPHYRTDFPSRDDGRFGKPIAVRKKDGELEYRFRNLE
jgi:succinate dehydrogenase/fumarate reductase flavoprotein subunit